MKKCYKELAKQKLDLHKLNGSNSNLSVFEAAQLFDVITGKSTHNIVTPGLLLNNISLN